MKESGSDTGSDIGADRLLDRGDDVYAALMAVHEDLSFEESAVLNARLVLILANLVGDVETIETAIARAKDIPRTAALGPGTAENATASPKT